MARYSRSSILASTTALHSACGTAAVFLCSLQVRLNNRELTDNSQGSGVLVMLFIHKYTLYKIRMIALLVISACKKITQVIGAAQLPYRATPEL